VVEDFGLSEGGSGGGEGGGGGGGEAPANMMTTDTEQTGLSGMKQWSWENYSGGGGSLDNPQDGDRRASESFCINYLSGNHIPLAFNKNESQYSSKDGWQDSGRSHLLITTDEVQFNDSLASWSNIIKAARFEQGFDNVNVRQRGDGSIEIGVVRVKPNSEMKIGAYVILIIDSNSKIASVRANGSVLDISVAVIESNGSTHRVSGIISDTAGLSFDSPITPAEGQTIYTHWTLYE